MLLEMGLGARVGERNINKQEKTLVGGLDY